MDVHLTPESEKVVNQFIIEGICLNPNEVISKALDLLKKQNVNKYTTENSILSLQALAGCLAEEDVFEGDSVIIQRTMRDEW